MINIQYGEWTLICDNCEEKADEQFNSRNEAVEYMRDNKWKIEKDAHYGDMHICNKCVRGEL